jgi:DNA-binding MarR family transcriptional regulator
MPFLALKAATQTTDGNLAVHLQKLEAASFIELTRDFEGRQRRTNATLTNEGRSAYSAYITELRAWLNL